MWLRSTPSKRSLSRYADAKHNEKHNAAASTNYDRCSGSEAVSAAFPKGLILRTEYLRTSHISRSVYVWSTSPNQERRHKVVSVNLSSSRINAHAVTASHSYASFPD
jgi:hypothetical protein